MDGILFNHLSTYRTGSIIILVSFQKLNINQKLRTYLNQFIFYLNKNKFLI